MASGPITSWQIDGETMERVRDFFFLGSKITEDGDCSHEIKRRLIPGRKAMTNLDSILKNIDITLPTKVHLVKAMVFLGMQSRKSRNTWSNRQIWPWSTKWSRAKTNRVLPRERTDHRKHPLSKTQQTTLYMDITRWSTPKADWSYSLQPKMEKLYTVSKNKIRSWLWLRSWIFYCKIQT